MAQLLTIAQSTFIKYGLHPGNDSDLDRLMTSIKELNQSAVFEDAFTI
jgi:hypothetical protein